MIMPRLRKILAPLLLSILLLVTSCANKTPSRFDQAQQQSSQQKSGQAVVKDATQGSNFNKFFPKPSNGYERVYTQEKKGFAQAKLKKRAKMLLRYLSLISKAPQRRRQNTSKVQKKLLVIQ
jgi:hypothetical protein